MINKNIKSINEAYNKVLLEEDKEIVNKLWDFFKNNPYPKDDKVHKFAEDNNINEHELENIIYGILSTFISGGEANKKGLTADKANQEQLKMGIEVEYEHVDKNSPYADMIAERISLDHLAELPDDYYTLLDEMEKKGKQK